MTTTFRYNGETFREFRSMTKAERERPLEVLQEKLVRYSNVEFEKYWNLDEFYKKAQTDANLFWWKGKLVMPSWDTFYIVNGWL